MITALHQVFGRKYGGNVASIPFSNTLLISEFYFSTRSGNCVINWGDGNSQSFTPSKNIDVINSLPASIYHNYSTAYTGNVDITFNNGLADVYSLFLQIPQSLTPETNTFNIQDFNAFINQFSNLYSLRISSWAVFSYIQKCNIKGNVADVPNSVERIELGHMGALVNPNDLYLDVSSFKVGSQLKWLNRRMDSAGGGLLTTWQTYGNLAKLPSQLYYFKLNGNAGTFTYSGTKVWASSFDTLDLGNASLSATDTDNLFNDMANSINTAIGSKIIRLAYCYRTTASNPAVAYLQSLGFTITVADVITPYEVSYHFNGNFNEENNINNLIQNGNITFTTDRKGGNSAIFFDGNSYLISQNNLPTSKVWSVSFWMKTSYNSQPWQMVMSLNENTWRFAVVHNGDSINNQIYGWIFQNSTRWNSAMTSGLTIADNTWKHIVMIFDTSQPSATEVKIYHNGVLQSITKPNSNETTSAFNSSRLTLGWFLGAASEKYDGALDDVKIYNRVLTQAEITNLYNE